MFFNNKEDKEREATERAERKRLKEAASKRRTDELMKQYYNEQREKELIAEAQEADYKINRKRMYTMPHYGRLQIHEDTWVERVPGGWIFYQSNGGKDTPYASTFVPFTEEKIEMFYKLKDENRTI